MARRSQATMLKRQREAKKAEKAARKRARRHGLPVPGQIEPRGNVSVPEDREESAETPSTEEPG